MDNPRETKLHHELIRGLLDEGVCPSFDELAIRLERLRSDLELDFAGLEAMHGVVLHPGTYRPWIVHPFSTTPTLNWIEGRDRSWWAPCMWCALGAATLVGNNVRIHTKIGAGFESLVIPVRDGEPLSREEIFIHFSIPPARAWENVHEHCSLVLAFRSVDDIRRWCEEHRVAFGEAVPLKQVAVFAKNWYGTHAHANWHKWTVAEAKEIFERSGLYSAFWDIEAKAGRF